MRSAFCTSHNAELVTQVSYTELKNDDEDDDDDDDDDDVDDDDDDEDDDLAMHDDCETTK